MKMNKYLSMDSKISLSRTKATDRPQYGKGGEVYQLLYIPRNIPLNDLKTFRSDTQRHIYYVNPTLQELNPYYINYQYSNMDERWRAFGYYTVKIDFTPWLYATGKYSFDYYDTSIEEQNRTNGIDDQSKESYKSMEQRYWASGTTTRSWARTPPNRPSPSVKPGRYSVPCNLPGTNGLPSTSRPVTTGRRPCPRTTAPTSTPRPTSAGYSAT